MGMINKKICIFTGLIADDVPGSVDCAEYYIEIKDKRYKIQFARRSEHGIKEFIAANKKIKEGIIWLMENNYWNNNVSLSSDMLKALFWTASENNEFFNLIKS